jgi:hypothetical protein
MVTNLFRRALNTFLGAVGYFLGDFEMMRKHKRSASRYPGDLRDFY